MICPRKSRGFARQTCTFETILSPPWRNRDLIGRSCRQPCRTFPTGALIRFLIIRSESGASGLHHAQLMTSGHPMRYFSFRPTAPLDEFVDVFWMIAGGDAARRERILPSGTAELVINLHEDEIRIYDTTQPGRCQRFSGAVANGTYSRPFACDARQHCSIIGVHFRPGGALPFLGVPAFELSDTHVNLE